MSTIAIIQARLSSQRFPGKTLQPIQGRPMIQRVVERVQRARLLDRVVLAIPFDDDLLYRAALKFMDEADIFEGHPTNVLERYYHAAYHYGADPVVRITGDCPLIDPALIDDCLRAYRQTEIDYLSTAYPVPTFPDGMDVEVIRFSTLERAWQEAQLPSEREHVTPYIWKHPELFRLETYSLARYRFSVDDERDLTFIRAIYRAIGYGHFGMERVIDLLRRRPELLELNAGAVNNAGYRLSVEREGVSTLPRLSTG